MTKVAVIEGSEAEGYGAAIATDFGSVEVAGLASFDAAVE